MEILGVGPLEALFVLLIALVVVGPRDLGKAARSAGRMLNRLYRSDAWRQISEASRNLRSLPNRLAREAALEELDQVRKDLREEVTRELRSDLGLEAAPGQQSESQTEPRGDRQSDAEAGTEPSAGRPGDAKAESTPDSEQASTPATGGPGQPAPPSSEPMASKTSADPEPADD